MKRLTDKSPLERFMERVEPEPTTGCWLWTGTLTQRGPYGYGTFSPGGGRPCVKAHRFAYAHFIGRIPDGAHVLHRCDTPACANPDHLFLGDQAVNNEDMKQKGRARGLRGERNGNATLTADDVRAIRERIRWGNRRALAAEYGVNPSTIKAIVRRKTWRHVE